MKRIIQCVHQFLGKQNRSRHLKKKNNVSQSGQEGFMHRYYCVLDWHILMLFLGRKKMNNFENNQPQLCAFSRPVANEKEKEKVDLHLSSPTLSIMFCIFLIILITVLNKKSNHLLRVIDKTRFSSLVLALFFFQIFFFALRNTTIADLRKNEGKSTKMDAFSDVQLFVPCMNSS